MKNNTAKTPDSAPTLRSLSPLQAFGLLGALLVAVTGAYLGTKSLLDDFPDTNHATVSDHMWSELEKSVYALSR